MGYALIDESGRLYDPDDEILVFAVVVIKSLVGLDKIFLKAREKIPKKGKRRREKYRELKFSLAGEHTRRLILNQISKLNIKVYLLIINKEGRKIKDNPENYVLLIGEVLKSVIRENTKLEHIIIDRHFTYTTQKESFNRLLLKYLKRQFFIEHLDSQQNQVISLADFVAGAIRFDYVHNVNLYKQMLKKIIRKELKVSWRLIKQKAVKL